MVSRSEIIWHKRSPMPESTRDCPTKSHEKVFPARETPEVISTTTWRSERSRPAATLARVDRANSSSEALRSAKGSGAQDNSGKSKTLLQSRWSHPRDVWTLSHEPFPSRAHFATYPTKLVIPCIKGGPVSEAVPLVGLPWKIDQSDGREAKRPK